jgi:hypothetical protein
MVSKKVSMENFSLDSFSFKTGNPRDVLGQIKQQSFFDKLIVQNAVLFFESTNAGYHSQVMMSSSRGFPSFKKIYSETCWGDISQWYCHISAPYFALEEAGHDVVFGFYHSLDRKTGIFDTCCLHSFVISDCGILRDPHFDSVMKQEEYYFSEAMKRELYSILPHEEWFEGKNQQNLSNSLLSHLYGNYQRDLEWRNKMIQERKDKGPQATIEDTSYYFGTRIPLSVIEILFKSNPKYPESMPNLWGYLKNTIFIDREKTHWFIDVVNNNGQGFVL